MESSTEKLIESTGPSGITFIQDVAATDDFFGSHGRLAATIAGVIMHQHAMKVIGLLGPWGSGKSTVIAQMQRHLGPAGDVRTHVFTYDAWLHQSDPPKRSFLERLVGFLQAEGFLKAADWQTELDVLDRRVEDTTSTSTPHLTTGGWMVLLSLILVPAGTRLIGNDWFKVMNESPTLSFGSLMFPIGTVMILSPLIMIAVVQLAWREVRNPFRRAFWRRTNWSGYRSAHSHRSLLALFMNKQIQNESKRVIKAPEPTTIEFQILFRKLLAAVQDPSRRFVLVVDNLDRLSGGEAIAMWTTIRSFFLGAIGAEGADGLLPTVILPIDETSVGRMFSASGDDARTVRSFMDKTFDLTFHVTPPVSSDWHDYLSHKLEAVFGPHHEEVWNLQIGRLYARAIEDGHPVTPRDLNKLVNGIAALWLQWRSAGIPMVSLAYFTIHRANITQDVYAAVQKTAFDISDDDPNWQRSIAALHFGIEPEHAIQVLLRDRLGQALTRGASAPIVAAAAIKGFERVLLKLIDGLQDSDDVEKAVRAVAGAKLDQAFWLDTAWRTMRRLFVRFSPDEALRRPNALRDLAATCPEDELQSFLGQAARLASAARLPESLTSTGAQYVVLFIERLWSAAAEAKLEYPPVSMNATPEQYLGIASALMARFDGSVPFHSDIDTDRLLGQVAADLQVGSVDHLDQRLSLVLDREKPSSWAPLIEAADKAARSTTNPAVTPSAIRVLGALKAEEPAAQAAALQLATDGWLATRTDEAIALPDLPLAARILALRLAVGGPLETDHPGGWTALVEREATFPALIDAAFTDYAPPNFLAGLIKQVTDEPDAKGIIQPVILARLKRDDLGLLYISKIVDDPAPYLDALPSDDRTAFINRLTSYDTFWESLEAGVLSPSAIRLYRPLISAPRVPTEKRQRARRQLLAALKQVSTADWKKAIRGGEEPLNISRELQRERGQPLALGEALMTALKQSMPELLEGSGTGLAERWFVFADLLSTSTRKTLLRNMRDAMISGIAVENLIGTLDAGEARLIEDGAFAARADDVMRHVVLPLVLEEEGQSVLMTIRAALTPIFAQSLKDTQNHLIELVRERWDAGEDVERKRLASLAAGFGFPMGE